YFRRLEAQVWDDPRLPVWNGELYFEYHRGTYTSQAQNNRANRQSEFLLQNAELYAGTAAALLGAAYPQAQLDEAWEIVLRNQFHDIIPGSSIHEVYEDSAREYERAFSLGGEVLQGALRRLSAAIQRAEDSVVVFNPLGVERSDLVELDLPEGMVPVDDRGAPLPVQGRLIYAPDVPANGYRVFPLRAASAVGSATPAAQDAPGVAVSEQAIETAQLRLELNERGQISRWYDKVQGREVLPPGRAANVLQAFEDKPLRFDAWDIDIYYQQKGREVTELVERVVEESGPQRGVLRLVWRFEDSTITQRLLVYARTPRVDFETHVDWRQSQVLLKVAFPVAVHATRATYEIQFGNVERPTHWNTSWDWARFETVGHKWADLSEGGYGVSLLNDCKYGYDVKDDVLRLTLIKSPISPDPQADRGEHRFTYSLYPHEGDWYAGGTVAQGYRLNAPLVAVRAPAGEGPLPPRLSLVRCTAPHVMVETVKGAEREEALVVRVYEFGNRRGPATLVFCRPVASAWEVNLLEEEPRPVTVEGAGAAGADGGAAAEGAIGFTIKPYEIKTFLVRLKQD
ncbi:MAG TPA: glycoside hydrolase family 38 C-terminal domain-containing protein, partial [Chloroflexota bacterium]|nr:glycoside hydrolase family 38 C-terminal domain-containing protein [Chloroflexota bacterium]